MEWRLVVSGVAESSTRQLDMRLSGKASQWVTKKVTAINIQLANLSKNSPHLGCVVALLGRS